MNPIQSTDQCEHCNRPIQWVEDFESYLDDLDDYQSYHCPNSEYGHVPA